MTALLSHHWRDDLLGVSHTGRQERKRTIRNGTAYRTRAGLWLESNPTLEVDASPPPDWEGAWDFLDRQLGSELQSTLGDRSDAVNRCMYGIRLAERPECWVNFKFLSVNQVEPVRDVGARSMTFTDAWNNQDLRFEAHDRKVTKLITCKQRTLRRSWRFTFRYAAGMSHAFVGDAIRFYDSQGVEVFTTRPPWARDSSGVGPLGGTPLRVTLVDDGVITVGQRTLPVGKLEVNADDWAAAVFPVYVDPSVTVSGATDTDDTMVTNDTTDGTNPDKNWGADVLVYTGFYSSTYELKGLFRLATSALPTGTVSAFSATYYAEFDLGSNRNMTMHRVAQANAGYAEGTAAGASQVGSPCWNKHTYNTVNWAGSAGLSTATTDYEVSSGGSVSNPGTGYETFSLTPTWISDWKNGTWTNAGMLFWRSAGNPGAQSVIYWSSNENATSARRPSYSITYTAGPAFPYSVLMGRRRR